MGIQINVDNVANILIQEMSYLNILDVNVIQRKYEHKLTN